jgi:drug/metabolite transporter (DMT)-like permease
MTNQGKAYILVGIAVLFWSTVATAFKLALRDLTFLQLLFFASVASFLSLLVVVIVQGKAGRLLACSGKDLLRSAGLGLLNPFLYYVVLFKAYSLLPAQEAQPLNYTWPIALAFLSVPLLKQRLTRRALFALLLSFLGVLVISTRGNPASLRFESPLGVGLAVGSSIVWALFWILNLRDRRDPVEKLFWNFGFGTVYVTALVLIRSEFVLPTFGQAAITAYVGLFEMGLTFVLWMWALSLSETTTRVSHFVFLSPFLSLFFIRFLLGEAIRASSILGLVLIVGGILVQTLKRGRSAPYRPQGTLS